MEARVRIENAVRVREPEYASPSCWCSCNRGTCVAGERVVGDVLDHQIPVGDQ